MNSKYLPKIFLLSVLTQMIYTLNQETVTIGTICPEGFEKFNGILLDVDNNTFKDFEKCIDKNFLQDKKKKKTIDAELKLEVENNMNYCFLRIEDEKSELLVKYLFINSKSKCLNKSIFQNSDVNLNCPPNHKLLYFELYVYPCVPIENIDPELKSLNTLINKNDCSDKKNFTKLDFFIKAKRYYCLNNVSTPLSNCSLHKTCLETPNSSCFFITSLEKDFCIPDEFENIQKSDLASFQPLEKIFLKQYSTRSQKVFGFYINEYSFEARTIMKNKNLRLIDDDFKLLPIEREQTFMEIRKKNNLIINCEDDDFKIYYIRYGNNDGVFCIDYAYYNYGDIEVSDNKKKNYDINFNISQITNYFKDNTDAGEFKPYTLEEAQKFYDDKRILII